MNQFAPITVPRAHRHAPVLLIASSNSSQSVRRHLTRIIDHRENAAVGQELFELRLFQLKDG